MLAKIGMPLVYFFLGLMFIKPVYGIAFYFCFEGFLNPQHYVPGYVDKHMGTVFLGVLTVAVLLRRRDIPHPGFLGALFCFLFFGFFSSLINGLAQDTAPFYAQVQMLKCVLTGIILTAYVRTRKEFFIITGAMIFTLNCNVIFQILQCWFGYATPRHEDVWWDASRYGGFFWDFAAPGGFYLIYLLPALSYCFRHAKNNFQRNMWSILLGMGALGVFLTITRSAFLGLIIFAGLVFIKDIKKASTVIVIIVLFAAIANFAGDKWTRETIVNKPGNTMKLDESASVRLVYWSQAFKLFLQHPLIGIGPDNIRSATRRFFGTKAQCTHNTPLSTLVEFGLLGFIPFCCIPIIAWRSLGRLIRSNAPFYSEFCAYYRSGMIAFMFTSMFFSYHLFNMGWLALFFPIVLEKIYKREQQSA